MRRRSLLHALPTGGDGSGLEVSLSCLLQDLVIQGQVGDRSLQTSVLRLQPLQPFYPIDSQTAVLITPPVKEPALSESEGSA